MYTITHTYSTNSNYLGCQPSIYYWYVNHPYIIVMSTNQSNFCSGDKTTMTLPRGGLNIRTEMVRWTFSYFIKKKILLISETLWYFFFHKNVYTSYFLYMLIFLFFHKHFDISYFASEMKMCFPSNIDCWRQRRAFQFLIFPKCPELL